MMFRRSLIDLVFPEDDETFRLHMDFYAVVMAQMVAGLFLIDEALYSYRQHDRNSAAANPVLGGRLHLSSRNWGNTYAEMLDRMLSTLARDHERRPRITSCAHGSPVATRYDERRARNEIVELSDISKRLARLPTPLKVAGWYFPVEVDPSWVDARRLTDTVQGLPRPLWISVYDNTNVGPETLVDWLGGWLPEDVNVFFQDGVGVHAREASVARRYADVLATAGQESPACHCRGLPPAGRGRRLPVGHAGGTPTPARRLWRSSAFPVRGAALCHRRVGARAQQPLIQRSLSRTPSDAVVRRPGQGQVLPCVRSLLVRRRLQGADWQPATA
jgi:hypothetical protein